MSPQVIDNNLYQISVNSVDLAQTLKIKKTKQNKSLTLINLIPVYFTT